MESALHEINVFNVKIKYSGSKETQKCLDQINPHWKFVSLDTNVLAGREEKNCFL
jgi:hypothetical protein